MIRVYGFFECWDEETKSIIHYGQVGERGVVETVQHGIWTKLTNAIGRKINKFRRDGYIEIAEEDHSILIVEYKVEGMGTPTDLKKRHALQDRLQRVLGWTGLGFCDGGSIGSGTMEVCCFVVDFDIARAVVIADLETTEFNDYQSIYHEQ